MAKSVFYNVRMTKLNEPNRFVVTCRETGVPYYGGPLFSFDLTDEEIDELDDMVMTFACRKFKEKYG